MTLLGKGLPVASLWWPLLVKGWLAIANCGPVLSGLNMTIMMIMNHDAHNDYDGADNKNHCGRRMFSQPVQP